MFFLHNHRWQPLQLLEPPVHCAGQLAGPEPCGRAEHAVALGIALDAQRHLVALALGHRLEDFAERQPGLDAAAGLAIIDLLFGRAIS